MTPQPRLCINLLIAIGLSGILLQGSVQDSPEIKFYLGDTALDVRDGVAAKDLAQLKIKVLPDDKSYTLHKWRVYIRRSTDLGLPREGSGEELHLHNAVVQPGDVVSVEIQTLLHTGANGKKEKVTLPAQMKYASIAIK